MERIIRLVSPVGESVVPELRLAPRLASLGGRSIALMDNKKPNVDVLLDRIGANLGRHYQVAATQRFRKPTTSAQPFDPTVFDNACEDFDAAIAAIGI